jgi:hypothetical protein
MHTDYNRKVQKNPCQIFDYESMVPLLVKRHSPPLAVSLSRLRIRRLGFHLLREVVGEGFSTLQTHAKDSGQTCLGIVV